MEIGTFPKPRKRNRFAAMKLRLPECQTFEVHCSTKRTIKYKRRTINVRLEARNSSFLILFTNLSMIIATFHQIFRGPCRTIFVGSTIRF